MKFPFNEPENVAVFTCVHVLEEMDICYVSHDEDDGGWQFLCGGSHDEADARVVSLREIFEIDTSIGALSDMPVGCCAVRDDKSSPWEGFRK
jgi:hypothetical protein